MEPEIIEKELRYRIESDIAHYSGTLPDRVAVAWRSYLTGLLEWSIIGDSTFKALIILMPGTPSAIPARSRIHPEAVVQELRTRIETDLARHGGSLPEHDAIAWHAYLAGLYEWSVISTGFKALTELLPRVEDDPAQAILSGRSAP